MQDGQLTAHAAATAALVTCTLMMHPLAAQTARDSSSGNAQIMQQLQQLASERTALQAENARLKRELDEMRQDRDKWKAGREALDSRLRSAEASLSASARQRDSADEELERTRERLQELVTRFREVAQTLREVETEQAATRESLAQREQELESCVARNQSLYDLNEEVLARMEEDGFFSRLARSEPFTQLKRVELENLVEDYRYRAEDQKISGTDP